MIGFQLQQDLSTALQLRTVYWHVQVGRSKLKALQFILIASFVLPLSPFAIANQFDLPRITGDSRIARLDFSESMPSTNDRAVELARESEIGEFPLLVLTRHQTRGRGQHDKSWIAEHGCLTFSLVVDQHSIVESAGLIPATVAVGVCEAIESTTEIKNLKIKWPNDIFITNCKAAGILIESVVSDSSPEKKRLVIGIGINVNNPASRIDYSADAIGPPAALVDWTNEPTCLTDLLISTTHHLLDRLNHTGSTVASFNERSYLVGKYVSIAMPDSTFVRGTVEGISNCGGLIVTPAHKPGEPPGTITVVSGRVHQVETA